MGTDSSLPTFRGERAGSKMKASHSSRALEKIKSLRSRLDSLESPKKKASGPTSKAAKLTVSMDKLVKHNIGKYQNKIQNTIQTNILPNMVTGQEAAADKELALYEKTMIKKILAQENNFQKTEVNTAHQRKIERIIKQ